MVFSRSAIPGPSSDLVRLLGLNLPEARLFLKSDYQPAPPYYPLRDPKYHLTETIRPLIEVHWGGAEIWFQATPATVVHLRMHGLKVQDGAV